MDEMLIKNWNEVVSPEDTVYHIGDVCMGQREHFAKIRARLMGHIILVFGNHDMNRKNQIHPEILKAFPSMKPELIVTVDGVKLYLRHIPDMDFCAPEQADYHLCGHVHQSWNRTKSTSGAPIINVGVDVRGYRPVSLQELINDTEERHEKSHRGY